MAAQLLDGKALAQKIHAELASQVQDLQVEVGRPPGLAVVLVGDHAPSQVYVRNKERACHKVGIASWVHRLPASATQAEVADAIRALNQDDQVDGILLQLPVPDHLDATALLNQIDPDKDVDGLHPTNLGRLVRGEAGLRSCTPAGVMRLLEHYGIEVSGKQAVVVGRSILVGKPLALMLLEADATVTVVHSRSQDLAAITQQADILIAAVGRPAFIKAAMVKSGAVVVDVGINRVMDATGGSRLVGDVDFDAVQAMTQFLTPVPGGIGPMTIAMLLTNTVRSYCLRFNQHFNQKA